MTFENVSLFPMGTNVNTSGHLEIGGLDVISLA